MDDAVRLLMAFVVRAFYSQQHVLLLDAVMMHLVILQDDLLFLLGMQRKGLQALMNRLVDDRLILVATRKEELPNMRMATRQYYYIHTTQAIDAIKWKVNTLAKQLKGMMQQGSDPEGYICRRCKSRFLQIDAVSLVLPDRQHFMCSNCGDVLVEDDLRAQARMRQNEHNQFMEQVDPIIQLLKKIDDVVIEDVSFEAALEMRVPAQTALLATYTLLDKTQGKSGVRTAQSLQAATQKSQATVQVRITADDEVALRETAEKRARQQKLQQNALPSWHSESTVGKQSLGRFDGDAAAAPSVKAEPEERPVVKEEAAPQVPAGPTLPATPAEGGADQEGEDALAQYYAQLAEQEAAEEEEEEEDFDDVELEDVDTPMGGAAEEDEFEDVTPGSQNMTPGGSSAPPSAQPPVVEEFDGESDEE